MRAAQVAILGMVKPNMRGITCGCYSDTATITFVFDDAYVAGDSRHVRIEIACVEAMKVDSAPVAEIRMSAPDAGVVA